MRLAFAQFTVADLDAAIAWYAALGLSVELRDEANGFALLAPPAGDAKLALQTGETPATGFVYLEVSDVAPFAARYAAPVKESGEGYRRVRLTDPDGNVVGLFARVGTPAARGL